MIKATLSKAGKETARLYIEILYLGILVFPVIFCRGSIFVMAMIADGIGLGHFGLLGLLIFVCFSFIAVAFFSIFAWPHISPEVGKALDTLRLE
ncbi:MAG TPA: hypothetical protein VL048_06615 [Xanthobacteraceae bacterium]|nr:hypothetical protein [Xanthobacteraceae bacterium]